MKRKYCSIEMQIFYGFRNALLSSSGATTFSEDDRSDNTVEDIFSGWWL